MKQTAVEWLINEHFGGIENCTPHFRKHIEEANKMFEQQIMDAHFAPKYGCFSEQYYNETFKSE